MYYASLITNYVEGFFVFLLIVIVVIAIICLVILLVSTRK